MSTPRFSVVIPTYGRNELLREAVESVLAQTVDDFECIVVDDAGPVPAEVPTDPRVRLVRRADNGGPGAARNTGVAESRGRYLAFLDDDDCYLPCRLELASEGLARAPVAVCWGGGVTERPSRRFPASRRVLEGDVGAVIREGPTPQVGCTALDRAAFVPFDERFLACQDIEWWLREAQQSPVATVPRVGTLHRQHPGTRHGNDRASRITYLRMIADVHADYFSRHPEAARFHWSRIYRLAVEAGDEATARDARRRAGRVGLTAPAWTVRAWRVRPGRSVRPARPEH